MPTAARTRLARMLADAPVETSQSAWLHLPADFVEVSVDGVGAIPLPVRAPVAKKLAAASTPAHFGRGEETLIDASVRDTGEIAPERVTLAGKRWEPALTDAVVQLGTQLGVADPRLLRVELHSLLVYGKGQFFAAHQDSEKHDDMVATLVVMLPSSHTGGELVVRARGTSHVYPGSRSQLTLVAFYPDCRHEVLPLRSGWRISLTFNVLLQEPPEAKPTGAVDEVAMLLREHFTTPTSRPYSRTKGKPPERLAVLLDHEYSRRALTSGRLKGEDAGRVALVMAAAEAAGCESVLAQTEIQETWDAQPSGGYYAEHDYYGGDEEDESEDPDDYELADLIDGSTVLTWWSDRDTAGEINLAIDDEEVCAPTPSHRLTPYESEYEGYMGNYGNTIDRWYRRAAVVIWPSEAGFDTRAEASPAWVLRRVMHAIEAGEVSRAREEARTLVSRWGSPGEATLAPALIVARGVEDADLARELLAPFDLQMVTVEHADPLAALAGTYRPSWWTKLAQQWDRGVSGHYGGGVSRRAWIETVLVPLCRSLESHGATDVCAWITEWMGDWVAAEAKTLVAITHPTRRADALERLGPALSAVLSVCDGEQAEELAQRIQDLGDQGLPVVLEALRSARAAGMSYPALATLASHARDSLQAIVAKPLRSPDDWSISWTSPGGEDQDRLAEFLRSTTERTFAWPLAAPRRKSIHGIIDDAGLPVTHRTIRSGSPYTLLLEKTEALFAREVAARRAAKDDLAWLQEQI